MCLQRASGKQYLIYLLILLKINTMSKNEKLDTSKYSQLKITAYKEFKINMIVDKGDKQQQQPIEIKQGTNLLILPKRVVEDFRRSLDDYIDHGYIERIDYY